MILFSMKRIIYILIAILSSVCANAQIGYQFSILDMETGEPRVNEKISVSIEITDSKGGIVFNSTQSATTDQFGVVSLSVGNESTFSNVDWANLPLYVSATVDGILISRSQILSVPVAEFAKATGHIDIQKLSGRWKVKGYSSYYVTIDENSVTFHYSSGADDVSKFNIISVGTDVVSGICHSTYVDVDGVVDHIYEGMTLFPSKNCNEAVLHMGSTYVLSKQ